MTVLIFEVWFRDKKVCEVCADTEKEAEQIVRKGLRAFVREARGV